MTRRMMLTGKRMRVGTVMRRRMMMMMIMITMMMKMRRMAMRKMSMRVMRATVRTMIGATDVVNVVSHRECHPRFFHSLQHTQPSMVHILPQRRILAILLP